MTAFLQCGDLHQGFARVAAGTATTRCSIRYLAEDKIQPDVVEKMRTWPHSGFSVDQSVFLAAGDRAGIERLVQYMTRCPFSLSRLVKVTETGQVIKRVYEIDPLSVLSAEAR